MGLNLWRFPLRLHRAITRLSFEALSTIWCLVAVASAGSTTAMIYAFPGGSGGRDPAGQLITDHAGNLYGTTALGGIADNGIVFELSPPTVKGGKWTETVLYSFTGGSDGLAPNPGLIFDSSGNLYGTTFDGGNCHYYCGVIFQLAPPKVQGGAWTESVLHAFGGPGSSDGGAPTSSLEFDKAGNLCGTAEFGGNVVCTNNPGPCGVVFQLSPPASQGGPWTETVAYNFRGIPDGGFPASPLTFDQQGNLYGTTTEGGTGPCNDGEGTTLGCGVMFEVSPAVGGAWTEAVLYNFGSSESSPASALVFGPAGVLYGTADYNVFRLIPPAKQGDPWTHQVLYQFTAGISGTITSSGLIFDPSGNLYGTTTASGLSGYGTVYELSPPTTGGKWIETTLHTFPGDFDTEQPHGKLMRSPNGVLYGASSTNLTSSNGTVFKIIP
jgi:hypothetical protein